MKRLFSIFFAIVIVCTICIIPASAASPKLNKTKVNLPIDYSITLKVSNADNVEWSTKDKSIAKIKSTTDNTAKIVGVKTGSTYIYAKTGSKTLKCKITVKKSFITAKNDEISIGKGKTKSFTVSVTGSKKIAYNNSNPKVCTVTSAKWVDGKLKFTIKGKSSGTAKIKVYAKGYSKSTLETITVTVGNGSSLTVGGTDSSDEKSSSTLTEAEKVVELVNAERAKKGLSPLTMDPTLTEVAELRAKEITTKFSHTRPDGTECFTAFDELGAKHGYAAENIAAGRGTAEGVMDQWINSPGHYDNIVNSNLNKIGVAVVSTSDIYGHYWVQVFTD